MPLDDFAKPLLQAVLDIEDKTRSSIFAWRGQFSPQLAQCLLEAYCPPDTVVLDPFAGSGTVLHEAGLLSLPACGYEINPAAWAFSKTYEFINLQQAQRMDAIRELRTIIDEVFPIVLFAEHRISASEMGQRVVGMAGRLSDQAKVLLNALVILLDLGVRHVSSDVVQGRLHILARLVESLPFSSKPIKADLRDARALPLPDGAAGFVLTSPPYINVFNYHQNYRGSAEALGWDVLHFARSEIGSNRANRGNRYCTVVQYCIDMADVLAELFRVLAPHGRALLVVGHESRVLGVPFYNADLIQQVATESGLFDVVLRQQRLFVNRFGEPIREDLLNLTKSSLAAVPTGVRSVARSVARRALQAGIELAASKSRPLLAEVLRRAEGIQGTPRFVGVTYGHRQSVAPVMMVREETRTI